MHNPLFRNTASHGYREAIEPYLVCALLIKTRDAVENIADISEDDGVDIIVPALFDLSTDLSTDLGIHGQFEHPRLLEALDKIETAANLPLSGIARSEPQAELLLARGYHLIAGVDILWLKQITAQTRSWLSKP